MKNILHIILLLSILNLYSQNDLSNRRIPSDTSVITNHSTTILGQKVNYSAQIGTQPIWDSSGEVIATLHYTYYKRTDIDNNTNRPLVFSFNGGPGSASIWMHMGYTGPYNLKIDDEGYPIQPYGYKSNPYSILDVADIVFVNPINIGYSRILKSMTKKEAADKFFGVNQDIEYLAEWISTFTTRASRWKSPKYLVGESYGGVRVMGLAHELQQNQWLYLNGVVLVSPADYELRYESGGIILPTVDFPYFTATAWYHNRLNDDLQSKSLEEVIKISDDFAYNELLPSLAKGGVIDDDKKDEIAKKIEVLTSIKYDEIIKNNLNISTSFFWKELLRDEGFTIGRLDSRYKGIDSKDSGNYPEYAPELSAWDHAFTPAINSYIKEVLNFNTDIKYNTWARGELSVRPWNSDNIRIRRNFREAIAENPFLNVLIQSGYYDGATTFSAAKYTMQQVDPSGKLKDRFTFKGYESGHMMYLRREDLKKSNQDLRDFIINTITTNKSAKY
jgi:carboxypeptidase C (cathepsin A)|tara:strand:+ start:2161 stop:3669 length:1509 start_codon:yes stop_codon:yes gene_type:complete